ncbi:DUF4177 domain-containing protein [Frigidibacter sp. MR17.14]|uniref:DUF4177 domain-containing protein n=1 Tax=Frigidibacter sp. MR17.14 TaxID=3126509 RepID=UPI003012E581
MQRYEYKVVPAPVRGEKARGLKTTADRFARALTLLMNEQATEGWEYVRSDTLPCEERSGLTGRATSYQNMLTFRRPLATAGAPAVPALAAPAPTPAPVLAAPVAEPVAAPVEGPAVVPAAPAVAAPVAPAAASAPITGPVTAPVTAAAAVPSPATDAAERTLSLVSALKARAQSGKPAQPLNVRAPTGEAPPLGGADEAGSPPPLGPADRKE